VFDPLMVRYPLTDYFVTEFGLGLLVINVLLALYVWSRRGELPAATPVQILTSPGAALAAK
jgi:hypothetical protein